MADRIEIETSRGRWWAVGPDLLVLQVVSCSRSRAPRANRKAAVEGHHDGRDDRSEGGLTCVTQPARLANDDPPTDVFHSEVMP
jgi:hypothetical protein